jgi:hypothetical protein
MSTTIRSPKDLQAYWLKNPLAFCKVFWPDVEFYDKQIEVIHSVRDNKETYVTAGNMLGKDFLAGFVSLWYFICNRKVRIMSTSASEKHLDVLWAEIDSFIQSSKYPLTERKGGPLRYQHYFLGKIIGGELDKTCYMKGVVTDPSTQGESLAGHHAPATLAIIDEASGVRDIAYEACQGWAKRMLIIGNPNPCTNFFYRGVKGGDLKA